MIKYYKGDIEPDADTIFVFGSNPEGRHGAGAAKIAVQKFGAIYGQGEGLQGNAYAIPTKDLRVIYNHGFKSIDDNTITKSIRKMYDVARSMPDKQFKIAYRNTDKKSLNGYTGHEMLTMFLSAGRGISDIPENVWFSEEWYNVLKPSFEPPIK